MKTEADWKELYEERAAIMEFHGRLTRKEAELQAGQWVALERLQETMNEREKRPSARIAKPQKTAASMPAEKQGDLFGENAFMGG